MYVLERVKALTEEGPTLVAFSALTRASLLATCARQRVMWTYVAVGQS